MRQWGSQRVWVAVLVLTWTDHALATAPPAVAIKTQAPPTSTDVALHTPRGCPLYELGVLREIKNHGETWHNGGSECELCKCDDGHQRCYYHYCNSGLTEEFMTPPSDRPPLDDEDREEEGSGRPPLAQDYYKLLHHRDKPGSKKTSEDRTVLKDNNETLPPPSSSTFCFLPCDKACPWGFKMDKNKECHRCKCRKCPSMRSCRLQCPGGLARDKQGCHACQCQSKMMDVLTGDDQLILDGSPSGERESPVHSQPPCHHSCNDNEVIMDTRRVEVSMGSVPELTTPHPDLALPPHHQHFPDDGTTKSVVQTSTVEWWQMLVIMVPLALVFLVVAGLAVRYWRNNHRDKYDINAYRPTETEKLRPVTTADDHLHARHC